MAGDGFQVSSELKGMNEAIARLNGLKQGARNKILRPAVQKMTRIVARGVKSLAPVSGEKYVRKTVNKDYSLNERIVKGLLKKAVAAVVGTTRDGIVVGTIGISKGFKTYVGQRTKGKKKGSPIYYDPARIAHLVELGHGGPAPAPPHSFMRAGFDATKGEAEAAGIAEIQSRLTTARVKEMGL